MSKKIDYLESESYLSMLNSKVLQVASIYNTLNNCSADNENLGKFADSFEESLTHIKNIIVYIQQFMSQYAELISSVIENSAGLDAEIKTILDNGGKHEKNF